MKTTVKQIKYNYTWPLVIDVRNIYTELFRTEFDKNDPRLFYLLTKWIVINNINVLYNGAC